MPSEEAAIQDPPAAPIDQQTLEDLLAEVTRLRGLVEEREAPTLAEPEELGEVEIVPQIALQRLDADAFQNYTPQPKSYEKELRKPMFELPVPEARFPDEAMYAVRLATQGEGYWPAMPLPMEEVRLADPRQANLIPKLKDGQMLPVGGDGVPDHLKHPKKNLIGWGKVRPWFVPSFRGGMKVYCDPRAAAASEADNVVIEKISLWCPLYTTSPTNNEHHECHGAFCGIGESPDHIQAAKWFPKADEDKGRCLGCKGHADMREATRKEIAKLRMRLQLEDE